MSNKTLLVVGATGLLGQAALNHFRDLPGWDVIGLSRRAPDIEGVRHLPADLTDLESFVRHGPALKSVTHVLYTALYEMEDLVSGWRHTAQMATNDAMFRNFMDVIEAHAPNLAHIHLLQGTKAYGIHVEPMRAPAKERWPRHDHENFYWLQEDHLKALRQGKPWRYTIWRPQGVLGQALGSPMNLIAAVAVHAAMCRERGGACPYPGGAPVTTEATDSRLLARAVAWAAETNAADDETFNITNGDVLLWPNLWPAVCAHFGVSQGPDAPMTFADAMPRREAEWATIVHKHGLRETTLANLVGGSWQFLDRAMRVGDGPATPSLVSTIKLRQAGFHDCLDTEDCLGHWFGQMQDAKLLPRW